MATNFSSITVPLSGGTGAVQRSTFFPSLLKPYNNVHSIKQSDGVVVSPDFELFAQIFKVL
jgi:hypothetical protein